MGRGSILTKPVACGARTVLPPSRRPLGGEDGLLSGDQGVGERGALPSVSVCRGQDPSTKTPALGRGWGPSGLRLPSAVESGPLGV